MGCRQRISSPALVKQGARRSFSAFAGGVRPALNLPSAGCQGQVWPATVQQCQAHSCDMHEAHASHNKQTPCKAGWAVWLECSSERRAGGAAW